MRQTAAWLVVAAVAAVWAAVIVRLPGPATTDPDGQASALYFDRLIHGQRLEEPLLSTPKPLLTLIHGLAWALSHDWRAITVLTVLAFAVAATALARAAAHLAGAPAAIATLVAMAGSGALMLQVARGNSLVWALAGWAVALAALTDRIDPRWPIAGAALLGAGLARTETWLLLPLAAIYVVAAWRRGTRAPCWLLLAFAAPALWLVHDHLLTGDLLWSSKVPARYTDLIAGRHVVSPSVWAADIARRYAAEPALLALALAGVAWLVARRSWVVLAGAGALALGVLLVLGWYAAQGIYISWRYFDPPDLALRLLAALGAAGLATTATTWLAAHVRTRRSALAISRSTTPTAGSVPAPAPSTAATRLPSAGLPSAGLPSAGLPSAGLPSAGLPAAGSTAGSTVAGSTVGPEATATDRSPAVSARSPAVPGPAAAVSASSATSAGSPAAREPSISAGSPAAGKPAIPARLAVAASAVACLAVIAVTWPIAPADPLVDSTLDRDTRLAANAATAIETLRPLATAGQPISVPGPQRVRVTLALDRRLDQVHDLFLDTLHAPLDQALGTISAVYHDADADRPADRFVPLTRTTPGALGPLRLQPILTDQSAGLYIHRVAPAERPVEDP